MRILLVDDESLIRMDLRDQLEAAGHEVVGEGKNGVEALSLARQHKPDVILMDVKMPELDGIEAARQIRYARLAPVVLLTAYSQADLVAKAAESGVYGYLIKPVREDQLLPALSMAMNRFHDDQALRKDIADLEKSLEERKLVSKATGILQEMYHISEDNAYKRIRDFSMDKQSSIADTCRKIIAGAAKRKKADKVKK